MNPLQAIVMTLLIFLMASKGNSLPHLVTIANLAHDYQPLDELDYVNYLKMIMARND
jgi:hypothetical protein